MANGVEQPVTGAKQASSATPANSATAPLKPGAAAIPFRPVGSDPASPSAKPTQNLQEVMNKPEGTSLSDVALKLGDLPFRLVGGIAAGGNPVVQYEYQKSPFTPLNWIFNYDAAPTADQALKWTDAQISLNDALEAGLVAKNTRSLKPNEPVTIKLRRRKGDGSPGLAFVFEPGQKDPSKPSDRYQLEFPMSSDIESRQTWVPALGYKNRNSRGINFVRFDAVDQKNYIVYDAKWNTTTLPKQKNDIERQMRALIQNPSWSLIVEVPNAAVEAKAMATYNAVIGDLGEPGHPRVEIRVVPPGTRDSSHYDSIPMESPPPPPIRKISPPRPGTPVMRAGS
jgi:hypothetical protein